MNIKEKSPIIRRMPNLTSVVEELKFLKSPEDVKYSIQKASFLLPRLLGKVDRWTKVPPSIQLEPTNACNLRCITCGRSKGTRPVGLMDFSLFQKIIDDASEIGVNRVQLYLMGEPLFHPKLVNMIKYIKSRHLSFHLTTNGSLLNEKIGEAILNSGVTSADYITFSILGLTKETHEQVMVGISHERVIKNIHDLLKNRKKLGINGPVIETVIYVTDENRHELEPYMKYWRTVVDHTINGGSPVDAFVDQSLPKNQRNRTCAMLWERMAIHWNGDVAFCSQDNNGENIVGNLRTQTIQEVWTGDKMTRLKQFHKEGQFQKISLCEFCDW